MEELDPIRQIALRQLDIQSQLVSLRGLVLRVLDVTQPGTLVDGVPPSEWLYRARKIQLERELLRLADEDVALASHVRQLLNALEN